MCNMFPFLGLEEVFCPGEATGAAMEYESRSPGIESSSEGYDQSDHVNMFPFLENVIEVLFLFGLGFLFGRWTTWPVKVRKDILDE